MVHGGELQNSCLFLQPNWFGSLKALSLDIQREFGRNAQMVIDLSGLPRGIEKLHLISRTIILPTNVNNLPVTLVCLSLEVRDKTEASEWAESLAFISESCPLLEVLTIQAMIKAERFNDDNLEESYSFKSKSTKAPF